MMTSNRLLYRLKALNLPAQYPSPPHQAGLWIEGEFLNLLFSIRFPQVESSDPTIKITNYDN